MKHLLALLFISVAVKAGAQNMAINNDGTAAHNKAILDLKSTDKGLLIPRMTAAQRLALSPDVTAKGLLVFQTDGIDGFYYYDGVGWQYLANGNSGWGLNGNGGTSPSTHFIGTTDNKDVVFKSNNTEAFRITSAGKIGIGTSTPSVRFDITDNGLIPMRMRTNNNAGYSAIQFYNDGMNLVSHIGYANTGASSFAGTFFVGTQSAVPAIFTTSNTERMRITTGGLVGIGTNNPSYQLDVVGDINMGAGGSYYRMYGIPIISMNGTNNFFTGNGAGTSVTTGSNNAMFGTGAGNVNTTGSFNTFFGTQSGSTNTSGAGNTFLGYTSGNTNTTGNSNTLVGYMSNIGSNNLINATAIGANAIVSSNNSLVLGGAGINAVKVGIGTAAPGTRLTLVGDDPVAVSASFQNTSNTGYAGLWFRGNDNANKAHFGYSNPGAANYTNKTYAGSIAAIPFILTTADQARVTITETGNVGIATQTPTTDLEVNGFTKLGSDAPAIKIKKLTGTTAATQGGSINIAHGISSVKIISVTVLVEYSTGAYIPNSYTVSNGYEFNFFVGTANITVTNINGNSGTILSKPVKVMITYEE